MTQSGAQTRATGRRRVGLAQRGIALSKGSCEAARLRGSVPAPSGHGEGGDAIAFVAPLSVIFGIYRIG